MNPTFYYILHVAGAFLLTAYTYKAFAAPDPARRRAILIITGLSSLAVLVGGFGLLARLDLKLIGWPLIKLVCWLALSGMAGVAYRRPEKTGTLSLAATVVILIAIYTVYAKPI